MTVHVVTGGAGFIGTNLVGRLLASGETVFVLDDLSLGRMENLQPFATNPGFAFHRIDCSEPVSYREMMTALHCREPITDVWHLAANSDISSGIADPRIDLRRTFLTTFETLACMRALEIPRLHFASSSAIYGDQADCAITEEQGSLEPVSHYGAMKLASEAQIRAAVESGLECADIFRFPNVVGTPATHGVIYDLVRKGIATPDGFEVLGDGTQKKIYLHVDDLVDAMLFIAGHAGGRYNVFNIGPDDEGVTVAKIAEAVRDRVCPGAKIRYGDGTKGWTGDVPRFRYSTKRLTGLGWHPKTGSEGAVSRAIDEIVRQQAMQ